MVGKTNFESGFRAIRRIAQGGIAELWLVEELPNGQQAVMKKLRRALAPTFSDFGAECLRNEVHVLSQLHEDKVIRLLDWSEADGTPILILEYFEAPTLWEWISTYQLSFDQAVSVVLQLGEAVSALHMQDIIHCDLKPLNILVQQKHESELSLKLIDFGQSCVLDSAFSYNWCEPAWIWGSPLYMAPEQFSGSCPTKATDVYALGLITYALFTGAPPFYDQEPEKVESMQCHQKPLKMLPRYSQTPHGLEYLMFCALEKNPAERFPDASHWVSALKRVFQVQ